MTKSILYGDLDDAALDAKILDLRGKLETVVLGGVALVVAGEGRRIEYSRANQSGLEGLVRDAVRERDRRAGVQITGAIAVRYGYADGGGYGC